MSTIEPEKVITCYGCGSEKVRATINITTNGNPQVNFQCTECIDEKLNIPRPILGFGVAPESLKFIFIVEEQTKEGGDNDKN
jgi:hypothetical protein